MNSLFKVTRKESNLNICQMILKEFYFELINAYEKLKDQNKEPLNYQILFESLKYSVRALVLR